MITLLTIIIGFIAGICFVAPALEMPNNKKAERHNIKIIVIAGLIGAIIFTLIFGI